MTASTETVVHLTDQQYAVEVDTALAALWDAEGALTQPLEWAVQALYRFAECKMPGEREYRWDKPKPSATLQQVLQIAEAIATQPREDSPWEARDAAKALADYQRTSEALREVQEAQKPFEAEYVEDRWTRAFLVLNSNGHVHRDRACSTCFPTTVYGWLPQVSGMDEAQIVELAGEGACTVCYPTAPVATLGQPRRLLHETEVEAQARRDEKAAAKAAKEAIKAAKAAADDLHTTITLTAKDAGWDYRGGISTIRKAKSFLTDGHQWRWDHPYYNATDRDAVAAALAARNGTTPEIEIAAAAKRAAKRG